MEPTIPHPVPGRLGAHLTLLARSRSLRRRAEEALERAATLRDRSRRLVRPSVGEPDGEEAEVLQWYRVQIREMLAAGWTAEELADVGITGELLRELGLRAEE